MITVSEKKFFIQWFMNNYQFKAEEVVYLLHYMLCESELMKNVHFVYEAYYCERALIISTKCADLQDGKGFFYQRNGESTEDVFKAYEDIKVNREPLYVQFHFAKETSCSEYMGVLEENPQQPIKRAYTDIDKELVERLLGEASFYVRLRKLEKELDTALALRDKDTFMRISKEYAYMKAESV